MDVNATIGYEVFRDILTLLLGVAAAAAGVTYAVIYTSLTKRVNSAAKAEMNKAIANFLLAIGFNYWEEHDNASDKWKLLQAINITKSALRYTRKLDERERDSKWIICKLKNNLAYFYAEKQKQKFGTITPDEKDSAQRYVKYIYGRIDKCPKDNQERKDWLDTRKFVPCVFG